MAEIMERNLNLEEVDADAFFGLKAFKYQTIGQKILFFGLLGVGIVINVALPFIFETPRIICIAILLVCLLIAVSFGCNYEEGLTYAKYVYQIIFKPVKRIEFISCLDKRRLRIKNDELLRKEDEKLRTVASATKESQRKLLKKLIIFGAIILTLVAGALGFLVYKDSATIHHEVTLEGGE